MNPTAPLPRAGGRDGGLAALRRLENAEDFFAFFELSFDPKVVQVYRLHVLKRFALEMEIVDRAHPALAEPERIALYREALRRSHDVFVRSNAQEEKLFRVFQGGGIVSLKRRTP